MIKCYFVSADDGVVGCVTSEIHNTQFSVSLPTVCPCVYVKTIMFMKAKSTNGQYVLPFTFFLRKKVIKSHGIVLIFFVTWYVNT